MPEGPIGIPRPAAKSNLLLFLEYGERRDDGPIVGGGKDQEITELIKGLSEEDPRFENIMIKDVEFNAYSIPDEGFVIRQILIEMRPDIELDLLQSYLSTLDAFLKDVVGEEFQRVTLETT